MSNKRKSSIRRFKYSKYSDIRALDEPTFRNAPNQLPSINELRGTRDDELRRMQLDEPRRMREDVLRRMGDDELPQYINTLQSPKEKSSVLKAISDSQLDSLRDELEKGLYIRNVIPQQPRPVGKHAHPIHKTNTTRGKEIYTYLNTLHTEAARAAYIKSLSDEEKRDFEAALLSMAGRRNKKRSTRRKKRRGKKTH